MNTNSGNPANASRPGSVGLSQDDIIFTLFRHKWLILGFLGLSIVGGIYVRMVRPPLYVSKAKLKVHYVAPSLSVMPGSESDNVRALDANAQTVIASEIEILTSLDVAAKVADLVGPARVLAKKGGGDNRMAAAGVICSGIEVDPPKSSIITISFKHPDAEVVQPVLEALLEMYKRKHLEVNQGVGVLEEVFKNQREEYSRRLSLTEEELKRLKTEANVLFLDETKAAYQSQISKIQESLLDAERELAERKALLGAFGTDMGAQTETNALPVAAPAETLQDYSFVTSELDNLKRRERELLLQYKEAYPLVQNVRNQIQKLTAQKAEMEQRYPSLNGIVGAAPGGTNSTGFDVGAELAEIMRLNARVAIYAASLSNIQVKAAHVIDVEPKINELTRQRDQVERDYQSVLRSIESRQIGESAASGKVVNMSTVQSPTPAGRDYKKMLKMLAVVMGGLGGMGVGLAFAIELFLDRSLKRRVDVERHLGLPVFLTIPDAGWKGGIRWPWNSRSRQKATGKVETNGEYAGSTAVTRWNPKDELRAYAEGLRERIITYFDVRDLNAKKPKLVAVAGCAHGAGVSTLASGLAAELSKTGDGNVLLVDMNDSQQGVAHSFFKGKPGCGLAEVLEPDTRDEALVEDKLYVASMKEQTKDKLAMVLPKRFTHLVPKLKASDYDYIIFDMPPVTQTSVTPRLSGYMDVVLLVLEAEKTGQRAAANATTLMREARANVAAVLNKYRPHVPQQISEEL